MVLGSLVYFDFRRLSGVGGFYSSTQQALSILSLHYQRTLKELCSGVYRHMKVKNKSLKSLILQSGWCGGKA